MTRAEKAAVALSLRNEGLLQREIAERMGCSVKTVNAWLTDPDGSKLKARKDGYRGTCTECGGQTDGSNGSAAAPSVCAECQRWTEEGALMALADWAEQHGGVPPRSADAIGSDGRLPTERTMRKLFGSWNDGLLAAGFELHCDRRPETWEAMLAAVREGVPTAEIAARFGVTPNAVHMRFRIRGMHVAAERPAGYYEEIHRRNGARLARER